MFIINLTYKVDLDLVNHHLDDHISYLEYHYSKGHFHVSGRKIPRTGGIILSTLKDKTLLLDILEKDPFKIHNLADYSIIEFEPSKTGKDFNFLLE